MANRITDIHCPSCGAPARFDIIHQQYLCGHCGGRVEIGEALKEKQGFRSLQQKKLKKDAKKIRLFHSECSGCGAAVVFGENEALSECAFCGKSLVRTEYLEMEDFPECVIPFALTKEEAREKLAAWCRQNGRRPEAGKLKDNLDELGGFYLPYELVRGPVHMKVSRMDADAVYKCEGFMEDAFVNCSKQLDNLLLDAMEPYDTGALTAFDFGYVAGQRVKTADISGRELSERAAAEAGEAYRPAVRKVLETQAVNVRADVSSAIRLPVLLPVYYICRGNLMAAVNGQTGKVSVRAEKDSHYVFLPWWLKAILSVLVFAGALFGALRLFGMEHAQSLFITGVTALFFLIVTLCLFSDTTRNKFLVTSGRKIFTSEKKALRQPAGNRPAGRPAQEDPVFFKTLDGKEQPVILRFTSPARVLKMALLCVIALFLPVIIALLLNGFDFASLNLAGSAVWFCIAVPVVPVYLLKFGIVSLHENPWVYTRTDSGKWKRHRKKPDRGAASSVLRSVLRALFVPPVCLAVWFGIFSFLAMVYLTAGLE